jgi:hypothetical protein
MTYNNRAILAMIAGALNECAGSDEVAYRNQLAEMDTTPDRNALLFFMADGRQFQISVEEVV